MNTPATDPSTERLRLARDIYRRRISPAVEVDNADRLVAIDVDSEDFEIGDDLIDATRRVRARHPEARVVGLRVGGGGRAVDRFHSIRRAGSP